METAREARKRGGKIKTQMENEGESVVIQYSDPLDDASDTPSLAGDAPARATVRPVV